MVSSGSGEDEGRVGGVMILVVLVVGSKSVRDPGPVPDPEPVLSAVGFSTGT
jgi:hypothetical protein